MVCRARVNEVATIAYATRVAARAELAGTGDGDGACADRRYARVGVGTGEDERAVLAEAGGGGVEEGVLVNFWLALRNCKLGTEN